MPLAVTLNDIARGDANPGQVRSFVADLLEQASREVLLDLYHALRAWVWKALDQRRRDSELRDWHDIIASSATIVGGSNPDLAAKLDALHELLSESIAVSLKLGTLDIHRRQHVAKTLEFLAVRGGAADREQIGGHLGLAQANLTRVLNLMMTAGLLERNVCGKRASFRLTRRGVEIAPPMHMPNSADSQIQARASQKRRSSIVPVLDDNTLAAVKRLIDSMIARGTSPLGDIKLTSRAKPEMAFGSRFSGSGAHPASSVVEAGAGPLLIPVQAPTFTPGATGRADSTNRAYVGAPARHVYRPEAASV